LRARPCQLVTSTDVRSHAVVAGKADISARVASAEGARRRSIKALKTSETRCRTPRSWTNLVVWTNLVMVRFRLDFAVPLALDLGRRFMAEALFFYVPIRSAEADRVDVDPSALLQPPLKKWSRKSPNPSTRFRLTGRP
jgi:hypothetical protein